MLLHVTGLPIRPSLPLPRLYRHGPVGTANVAG